MTDVLSGEQVAYQYDSLTRLIQAQTVASGGWGQSFGYDGWGNLLSKTPTAGHTGTSMSLSADPSTNRVMASGFAYDANGNMTSIPGSSGNIALIYDIENRTGGNWYDQQNQPLDRAGVWNLYGLRGERLGTYTYTTNQTPYQEGPYLVILTTSTQYQASRNVYFGGRMIQSNGTTVLTDRLGSVRETESGTASKYYPFGEEVNSPTSNDREKFATYTRESATGLDYANQRYYSSVYGAFTTPDRYQATASGGTNPSNPGSWNRYPYVGGDPINYYDPTGQIQAAPGAGGTVCPDWDLSCQYTVSSGGGIAGGSIGGGLCPPGSYASPDDGSCVSLAETAVPATPTCGTVLAIQASAGFSASGFSVSNLLGITSFFEDEAYGNPSSTILSIWTAIDWTFENRAALSKTQAAAFYGPGNAPTTFQGVVAGTARSQGSQVWSSGTLKGNFTGQLDSILGQAAGSAPCAGLTNSIEVGVGVSSGYIANNVPGALQFASGGVVPGHGPGVVQHPVATFGNFTFYQPVYPTRRPR